MIKILTILFLLSLKLFTAGATNHYVSNSGSEANPGTLASPWLTISKVNASMASISMGDSILFERGGTFRGSLILTKSGNAANNIVIGAYGTGAKPVISGFSTLSGWTNVGANLWEATANLKSTVTFITIDGNPYAMGRTPNEGSWLTYQTSTATQLTSTALAGVTVYPGEEVVTRKQAYAMSRGTITFKSGNVIDIAPVRAIEDGQIKSVPNGRANYGFFLQNFATSLDVNGEWYYNPLTNKMRLYSTVNPSAYTVRATAVDTLIILGTQKFITVENLSLEGAGMYAVEAVRGSNITVQNCDINCNTRAVYIWNCSDAVVRGNKIKNSFNVAILISNRQGKRTLIDNNKIDSTGLLIGAGIYGSHNLKGIVAAHDTTTAGNFLNITNNKLSKVGYHGIDWQGSNAQVLYNTVDSFCSKIDDGGGLYTWVNNSSLNTTNFTNRLVANNVISNGVGAPAGTDRTYRAVKGIYIDDQSLNIIVQNNSVYNMPSKGMTLNNPKNIILRGNKFYNCDTAILIDQKQFGPVTGNRITQNQFYQKSATQFNYFYINDNLAASGLTLTQGIQNAAYIDSNYITNLKTNGYGSYYSPDGVTYVFPAAQWNLGTWKATYGHDLVSSLPSVTVTPTNTRIVTNPSDTVLNYSFYGFKKITPDGTNYDNSVNVPRGYNSVILIDNGTSSVPNIPPVASIQAVADITLPTSQVTLTSASTDADGTISSYVWSKVSGGSATIANSTLISSVVNSLVAGPYQFRLIVTDNVGAKDTAFISFLVNPAVAPPNIPPTVNAGSDQVITLPTNSVSAIATASDADGTIVSYKWTKQTGPASYTIVTDNAATTSITGLVEGAYNFRVVVYDNSGDSSFSTVHITVNPAPMNTVPIPNAGLDDTLRLPINTTTLTGSGTPTTAGATITGFSWTITSGPVGATLGSASTATTTVNNLTEGVYMVALTVTDSNGLTAVDFVTITVNAVAPPDLGPYLINVKILP